MIAEIPIRTTADLTAEENRQQLSDFETLLLKVGSWRLCLGFSDSGDALRVLNESSHEKYESLTCFSPTAHQRISLLILSWNEMQRIIYAFKQNSKPRHVLNFKRTLCFESEYHRAMN
jgi:hypothetical protein